MVSFGYHLMKIISLRGIQNPQSSSVCDLLRLMTSLTCFQDKRSNLSPHPTSVKIRQSFTRRICGIITRLFYQMSNPQGTLSYESLKQRVVKWCLHYANIKTISRKVQFKALPSQLQAMDSQFRIKIVLYLLLRTFNWMFTEETMDRQLELSLAIKEEYRKLLLGEVFRGDNHFELFVLFHIKVTVLFILDEFERVQVDNGLECELCVVLYYTILGIEVNQKTYRLLVKRYLGCQWKNKKHHDFVHSCEKTGNGGKKSIFSISNKSRKALPGFPSKKLKSYKYIRFSRHSMDMEAKSSLHTIQKQKQNFQAELKQHLKVHPLPKLKKKRLNIQEYEKMMTEPVEKDNPRDKPLEENHGLRQRLKHIFSNQLSSALKIEYPKDLLFELNSKKVKLNQTAETFVKERRFKFVNTHKEKQHSSLYAARKPTEDKANGRLPTEEWRQLVSNLKKKVFNLKWREDRSTAKQKVKLFSQWPKEQLQPQEQRAHSLFKLNRSTHDQF